MSTDCTPRYCYADPYEGGKQAVAECYRNISAVGALPLAITNCLNFANPQRPEIMAQIVECLRGMGDACRALDFPIVSGNVSLYNESKATGGGSAILPTPAIGGVGLMQDHAKMATIGFKAEGEEIFLIQTSETIGEPASLGQSIWLREILGREEGSAPSVSLPNELKVGTLVRQLIASDSVTSVHDISDGGLLVALTEMALAGGFGAAVQAPTGPSSAAHYFGEVQGSYLVTTSNSYELTTKVVEAGCVPRIIGTVYGSEMLLPVKSVPLTALREASDSFFRNWMEG
jgi:phosphoribosylformylglycinamidine synthase subunit PurL